MATASNTIFTEATRPGRDIERVSTLSYTHPVVLPEDVKAGFEVASPPLRVAALALDLAISIVVTIIVCMMLAFSAIAVGGWAIALIYLTIAVVQLGYFFIFEGLIAGQTPGKVMTGLKVISSNGEEITPRQGLVRSLIRLVEIGPLPVIWLIVFFDQSALLSLLPLTLLWVVVFVDKRHRRFGDIVAGTLVVRQRIPYDYGDAPPVPGYFELSEQHFSIKAEELNRLNADDFVRLEDFGRRIRQIRSPLRQQAAMVAAFAVAKKMNYSKVLLSQQAERFLFEIHAAIKEQLRQLYPDLYL